MRTVGLVALIAAMTLSCSTTLVKSTHRQELGRDSVEEGLLYYLPKNLVKLTIDRVPATMEDLKKALKAKAEVVTRAKEAAGAAKKVVEAQKKVIAELPDRTSAARKAEEQGELAVLEAKHVVAAKAQQEAEGEKQAADDEIQRHKDFAGQIFRDKITLVRLPAIADPKAPVVAAIDHSAWRDDELTLEVSDAGLLKAANGTAADRTGDLLEEAAKIVIDVAKLASGFPIPSPSDPLADDLTGDDAGEAEKPPELFPFHVELTFDPVSDPECEAVNEKLEELRTTYELKLGPEAGKPAAVSVANASWEGLLYRRAIPYRVHLLEKRKGVTFPIRSEVFDIPNEGPLAVAAYPAKPLVTSVHSSSFKDGMLTRHETEQPSGALAGVRVLGSLVRNIVALPTELFQLKIDHSTKEAEYLAKQQEVIDAEAALQEARKVAAEAAKEDIDESSGTDL